MNAEQTEQKESLSEEGTESASDKPSLPQHESSPDGTRVARADVTTEEFIQESRRIRRAAEDKGIQLRLLGSLAYRFHCPEHVELLDRMDRVLTDIDYVGRSDQSQKFRSFLENLGYECDERMIFATEGDRFYFEHPDTQLGVDIFVDKLDFCHTIPLKDRLELDAPTIPLEDLLLEKMQIVKINEKDLKDTFVLLLEHELSDGSKAKSDPETLDLNYLADILCSDWGFYYTVTRNLRKCKEFLPDYDPIKENQKDVIRSRIDGVLRFLEDAPKSLFWKLRSLIGTRVQWYTKVSEKGETPY